MVTQGWKCQVKLWIHQKSITNTRWFFVASFGHCKAVLHINTPKQPCSALTWPQNHLPSKIYFWCSHSLTCMNHIEEQDWKLWTNKYRVFHLFWHIKNDCNLRTNTNFRILDTSLYSLIVVLFDVHEDFWNYWELQRFKRRWRNSP